MIQRDQNVEDVAQWVNRLDQPTVDAAASEAFDQWMRADPRNRDDFADMQALWHSDALTQALREASIEAPVQNEPAMRHHFLRRVKLSRLALAACAALALFLLVPSLYTTSYRTGPGNGQSITLADGSHVDLSGNAVLRASMLPWRRDVTLAQGEAFFDVRHDADRPFQVRSDSTLVRVLGTAFNVDRQDDNRVVVDVYRGAVALKSSTSVSRVLHKGERSRVLDGGITTAPAVRVAKVQPRPDWTAGWFEATDVPLHVLIAKVQRYSAQPISVEDDRTAKLPVSGRFRIAEPDRVLSAIRDAYDLDVRRGHDAILILRNGDPQR